MRYARKRALFNHGIPALLSVPPALLAAAALKFAIDLPMRYRLFLEEQGPKLANLFAREGVAGLVATFQAVCLAAALLITAGAILGLMRRRWSLSALRWAYSLAYGVALFAAFAVCSVTGLIFANEIKLNGSRVDSVVLFYLRWNALWPLLLSACAIAILHVLSYRRAIVNLFTGHHEETPSAADILVEDLRTHGRDPRFRKSALWSLFAHFAIIVLIPLLGRFGGCVEPYELPEGSGNPVVTLVQVVKPVKKKPKPKPIFNPKSAISVLFPSLDDSDLMEKVEEETQLQHVADPTSVHAGKLGAGSGSKGGWPEGTKRGIVRMIRLEYNGDGWNDGMDNVSRADINFLRAFAKDTGLKTAPQSESHSITRLADYDPGYAPPFVFMTGNGSINLTLREIEVLRRYIQNGGMLIVDCGSVRFDRNFRATIQSVFPGESLLNIADDDPIYQIPFAFPNGAPPLWHHGGSRALGIRRGSRWAVFYHPGDMNDAWKTGHSGMSPVLARSSMQLGINVIYHAVTHYLDLTRKYRKK